VTAVLIPLWAVLEVITVRIPSIRTVAGRIQDKPQEYFGVASVPLEAVASETALTVSWLLWVFGVIGYSHVFGRGC
jgi:hypothetical protein